MSDLVGTCPKDFWEEWIAEGDAAGDPVTGLYWHWYTNHRLATHAKPGDRFYIVAHGRLRGYAPVVRVQDYQEDAELEMEGETPDGIRYAIIRKGGAVAVTIPEPIPGFRGLRLCWWKREQEIPFPDWKTP